MSTPTKEAARLVGGISIDHGRAGDPPRVYLRVDRHLKSGLLDEVALTEDDLLRLIADAAQRLQTLRGSR